MKRHETSPTGRQKEVGEKKVLETGGRKAGTKICLKRSQRKKLDIQVQKVE